LASEAERRGDDVGARAQAAVAGAVNQHAAHPVVLFEAVEGGGDEPEHLECERVDGGRAVERDASECPVAHGEDETSCSCVRFAQVADHDRPHDLVGVLHDLLRTQVGHE
jgi:hypothetical protein